MFIQLLIFPSLGHQVSLISQVNRKGIRYSSGEIQQRDLYDTIFLNSSGFCLLPVITDGLAVDSSALPPSLRCTSHMWDNAGKMTPCLEQFRD